MTRFDALLAEVRGCTLCAESLPEGPRPVVQLHPSARLLIAGQAPGRRVHAGGVPFDDPSGDRLRDWMGVTRETFYDARRVAILPMGFCYPGTGPSGDLPPRPECAETWRARLLERLRRVELTLVLGRHALAWHLGARAGRSVTDAVRGWSDGPPDTIPLPHPSPRNNRWLARNPWFEAELLPELRRRVRACLGRAAGCLLLLATTAIAPAWADGVDADDVPDERARAERAVAAAVERAVELARAGRVAELAGRLACWSGAPGPGTLHHRPCLLEADGERVRAAAGALREAFGADAAWVLDWLKLEEDDGVPVRRTQVKVRSGAPPARVELRFVRLGEELLLADAGAIRLEPPPPPAPPAAPREAAERAFETLLRLAPLAAPATEEAAATKAVDEALERLACGARDGAAVPRPCDPSRAEDRARAGAMLARLQTFLGRVGPTGWGFVGDRAVDRADGLRLLLEIGWIDRGEASQGTSLAAFVQLDGRWRLDRWLDRPGSPERPTHPERPE